MMKLYANVKDELVGYQNLHHFNLGNKKFVIVDLLILNDGKVEELNFQTFREEKWLEILDNKAIDIYECVPQNIMIGDFYN